jgi:hypothetical protein
MNHALRLLLAGIMICCMQTTLWAQTEAESAGGSLELQSTVRKKTITIPVQTKIGVKYTVGPRRYRNLTLDQVMDTSVVVSGTPVGVQYLDEIMVRDEDQYRAGTVVLLVSVGIFAAFLIVYAILLGTLVGSLGLSVALIVAAIVLGIAAAIAMPGGLIVGLILMAAATKKYSLYKDWKVVTHPTSTDD